MVLDTAVLDDLEARRMTFFAMSAQQLKLIELNPEKYALTEAEVLPWIAQYTQGPFYLSTFSVGFESEKDELMFKLAFKR